MSQNQSLSNKFYFSNIHPFIHILKLFSISYSSCCGLDASPTLLAQLKVETMGSHIE